ncbi:TonB-dependent receptor [Methylobacterium planeticum]|uniref:TonB-dependent receptor n=1 Tax=Methylobacterium planeticum TaxID=2615211 RepID=A0A6N6MT85_9HYPH|nr:TonB-dependent receptor [Methylobacterium planeticum]
MLSGRTKTIRLPGYDRFDLGLFHGFNGSVRAQVNNENIFDRRYICMADNTITPDAPRTIRAQIIARF